MVPTRRLTLSPLHCTKLISNLLQSQLQKPIREQLSQKSFKWPTTVQKSNCTQLRIIWELMLLAWNSLLSKQFLQIGGGTNPPACCKKQNPAPQYCVVFTQQLWPLQCLFAGFSNRCTAELYNKKITVNCQRLCHTFYTKVLPFK